MAQGSHSHRSRSPLSRVAKDRGATARVANPYSENEDLDREDEDYTVVGPSVEGQSQGPSEADTLVPGAVQHVYRPGYPSDKGVKKSLDINEKPNRKKNRQFVGIYPKPTKAQVLAEPVTHHLYFKAAEDFNHPAVVTRSNTLHKLRVDVVTPKGRVLGYEETVGRMVVLDYNKKMLSEISTHPSSTSIHGTWINIWKKMRGIQK